MELLNALRIWRASLAKPRWWSNGSITTRRHQPKGKIMSMITTTDGTQIYYKDWGTGHPIIFSHGWPLSADAFEDQMFFLASHGYCCSASS